MKIDASRYTLFWKNPDRYRLRELLRLAPIEPKAGTFAALLTYGRRRGTCFHELRDTQQHNIPIINGVEKLVLAGFGNREIEAAIRMVESIDKRYPNEQYLCHEVLFEYPIPGSTHIMTGRIDHILNWEHEDGIRPTVGDWKGTKVRTKKDMAYLAESYKRSAQVPFYLLGASTLGYEIREFLYRLVIDDKKKNPVPIEEHMTTRTGPQLKRFAMGVAITCDLISHMIETYGFEKPWPQMPETFNTGYESLIGNVMALGVIPEGFTEKVEHLETMMDEEELEAEDAP